MVTSSDVQLGRILDHISVCRLVNEIRLRRSSSGNGYHVAVDCDGPSGCLVCRLVFDSPKRLDLDVNEPEWAQDVLWSRKTYVKGEHKMVGEAGEWENANRYRC